MKNILIAIFLSATLGLGALCLHRQTHMAELQAQLAAVQTQLAEKAEAEDEAARAEQKLKGWPDRGNEGPLFNLNADQRSRAG